MGYFMKKFGIALTSIKEAEADGQDMNNTDDQPIDYNNDDNSAQDQQPTDTNEDNNDQQQNNENNDTNDNPTANEEDSTMDYNEEDVGSDDGADDNKSEGNQDSNDNGDNESQPVNDIKKQEEDIYSDANMTQDQLDIKHKELKSQFLAMYDLTSNVIDRIGDVNTNEENIAIVEFISENLSKLRTMLTDYIDSVYAGKSYMENAITFNRFLATLNGINKMLEQIEEKGR